MASVAPPIMSEKGGSVGVPLPGVEVRIVDPARQDLPAGEVGEILVRAPQLMLGYWGRPEETAAVIREGWLHTGDLGFLGADGYLYFVDRMKDVIETDRSRSGRAKLEQMRLTVDEKMQDTLEKRLGDSFKLVSERLEQVHKGLGEMQTLASGVGDLKRVLTNVRTRGSWGEVQLESILDQVLTVEQYAKCVAVNPDSHEMVDFAIRLPGRGTGETPVWLPIDAKFPREDYERLLGAQERADAEAARSAGQQLERAVRLQAKSICDKYICSPHTTDFAVMFLPTEGLYAEVIRRPGIVDALQRECRVLVAGPTTFAALLNSLQMGFRTLAIEKRTSEVWQVLGAVKTEFGKFGEVLDKVKRKIDEAGNQIEQTGIRSRAITRKLKAVQTLPSAETERLLGASAESLEGGSEDGDGDE